MNAGQVVAQFVADISGFMKPLQQTMNAAASWSQSMLSHANKMSSSFLGAMRQTASSAGSWASQILTHTGRAARGMLSFGASVIRSIGSMGQWVFFAKQGVMAAAQLVGGMFSTNASLEQVTTAFRGLLGSASAANDMIRALTKFAAETPFELPDLEKDSQMLLGMGVAARDIIPWMRAIGDAAAGVGAGTEGVQSITMAMGQMQAKGKIAGDEMMQLTEAGIPAWKILAKSMGLTVAQVQDLASRGELGQDAINKLVAGMESMYSGQMKNQANTFNGLLSTLADNARMAWTAFTGPAFKQAEGGLKAITDLMSSPKITAFATEMGQRVGVALATVARYVGDGVTWFKQLNIAWQDGAQKLFAFSPALFFLRSIFSQLDSILRAVLGPSIAIVQQFFAPLASKVSSASVPTAQFTDILRNISNVLAGFNPKPLADMLASLTSGLLQGANDRLDVMHALFDSISGVLQKINWAPFLDALSALGEQALPVFNTAMSVSHAVFSALVPIINKTGDILATVLVPIINMISPSIAPAIRAVGQFAVDIGTRLLPIINNLKVFILQTLDVIKVVWVTVWPYLSVVLRGTWDMIRGIIQVAWSLVSGIIKVGLDVLSGNWSQAWEDIKQMFAGVWDGIKLILSGAITQVKGVLAGAWAAISFGAEKAWNWIKDTIGRIWGGILSNIRGFINSMIDQLNGGIRAMSDFANGVIDAVNWVASKLGLKLGLSHIAIAVIPHLEKGTSNFAGGAAIVGERGPELAVLPRGTAVLPAGPTARLLGGGGLPSFAGGTGDPLAMIWGWLTSGTSSMVSGLMDHFNLKLALPGSMGGIAGAITGKITDAAKNWVSSIIDKLFPTSFNGNLPQAMIGEFLLPHINAGWHVPLWYGLHQGMDFGFSQGSPLREVIGGKVYRQGWFPWGGEIDVALTNGLLERYLHLSALFTKVGDLVARGTLIGLTGGGTPASGLGYWSGGEHLHYQVDRYDYNNSVYPPSVWASYGLFHPFSFARGGMINEPVVGMGLRSGRGYTFGEEGPERVTPGRGSASSGRPIIIKFIVNGREFVQSIGNDLADEIILQLGGQH